MNSISIKDLVKVYEPANRTGAWDAAVGKKTSRGGRLGTRALNGVNLEVKAGDFFGLLGANGAGKTTIIGILTSLVNKTQGTAQIFGHDIDTDLNAAKREVGVVPQEFNFSIFEKVIDIVVAQGGYFGVPKREALQRAEVLLKALELWDKRDNPSRTLSGGMKRRLMVARALIHNPRLLFLDEPTAGVDVELRHGMWKYLRRLNEEEGVTIFLTTHNLEEAEELCRNVAIIKSGEIVRNDSVKNLTASLEKKTYVLTIENRMENVEYRGDGILQKFEVRTVDDVTLEADLHQHQTISELIHELREKGYKVTDIRQKGNRLEQLFLNVVRK